MKFPVFITIVVLCIFFKFFVNRYGKNYDPDKSLLEKEALANATPKKNIDNLPYIKVDPSVLPLDVPTDRAETIERQDTIRGMSGKKILNLTGISNTDLKLEYGAPNISFLSSCDGFYTRLVMNLARLAEDYINNGYVNEAKTLLEYGISVGTDVKKNYTLLADIYINEGTPSKIKDLLASAENLNSLSKPGIIAALELIDKNS